MAKGEVCLPVEEGADRNKTATYEDLCEQSGGRIMKKSISRILAAAMCMTLGLAVTGCGSSAGNTTTTAGNDSANAGSEASGNKEIKKLTVAFVPSRDPQDIITAT